MDQFIYTKQLIETVLQRKPMHKKFLFNTFNFISEIEKMEAEYYIKYLIEHKGCHLNDLANAYITIVDDTFREELFFKKNGHYRHSSYDDVADSVYHNDKYMWRYMIGLALSSFWWINHVQIRRFFLKCITGRTGKNFLEIGPGHGLYFLDALKESSFDKYHGIDISSTSLDLTREILESDFFGRFFEYSLWQENFITFKHQATYDFLLMGEVLEHVERPDLFLSSAYNVINNEGYMFLTTCYNSPAIDHIYNPGSLQNLNLLIDSSGFVVSDIFVAPKSGYTVEQCEEALLPVNVAVLLKKDGNR